MTPAQTTSTGRTVIFLHIPKSAGTTLGAILRRQYSRGSVTSLRGEAGDHLRAASDADKASVQALIGHMPFGFHECFPHPCTYVTVLREPIARVISFYYHVRRDRGHYLHRDGAATGMSLEQFVSSGVSTEANNGQTRAISGEGVVLAPFPSMGIGFDQCPPAMLDRAIGNLREHFPVVGLSERFDETLMLLRQELRWTRTPYYCRERVGRNIPTDLRTNVPRRVAAIIERYNELDCALYEYAVRQFDERLRGEPRIEGWRLAMFKMLNGSYGRVYYGARSTAFWTGRRVVRWVGRTVVRKY
jgi:hypothetical protein